MLDPESGPFLFDTSAESWFIRNANLRARDWMRQYLALHRIHVSAITVFERTRGYSLLWQSATQERRAYVEAARVSYLRVLGTVLPFDTAAALVAAELMAALPHPPTPPKTSHQAAESRSERLGRWRFDVMIAATALLTRMPLIHNNPADFEPIRSTIEISPLRFPGLGPLELIRYAVLESEN